MCIYILKISLAENLNKKLEIKLAYALLMNSYFHLNNLRQALHVI
jgi:hypothetical protein